MGDVHHKGFQVRVVVEQIVEKQEYASSPIDTGRSKQTIPHLELTYPIKDIELSEFLIHPVDSLQQLIQYERDHGRQAG